MEGEGSEKEPSRPLESTRIDPGDKQCDSGGVMRDHSDGAELEGLPTTLIGSVQRGLHLIEAVCNHSNGAPAKLLAREVGLHLCTTYHLLGTRVFEGYVVRLPDGSYVLSDRVASLLSQCRVPNSASRRGKPCQL